MSVEPHARVLGDYTTTRKNGVAVTRVTNAVATGVAPDPTLGNLTPDVTWSLAYLHVGLEGLNANRAALNAQSALGLLHGFVSDNVSVAMHAKEKANRLGVPGAGLVARRRGDHEVPLGLR